MKKQTEFTRKREFTDELKQKIKEELDDYTNMINSIINCKKILTKILFISLLIGATSIISTLSENDTISIILLSISIIGSTSSFISIIIWEIRHNKVKEYDITDIGRSYYELESCDYIYKGYELVKDKFPVVNIFYTKTDYNGEEEMITATTELTSNNPNDIANFLFNENKMHLIMLQELACILKRDINELNLKQVKMYWD